MLNRKITKILHNLSIRTKLVMVFISLTLIIFGVNVFMYYNINKITKQLDEIYVSNINLNNLSDGLTCVQTSMTAYLNTKTSDAIEQYYIDEQNYNNLIEELQTEPTNNELKLMERNIRCMSESYLEITDDTLEAKRGRNVEKYKDKYEEAKKLYQYIETYIYSLNNEQFKNNTRSYEILSDSLQYLEMVSIFIFIFLAVCNVALVTLVTGTITNPLKILSGTANQVAKGNLNVGLLPVTSMDEVGVVTLAFNQMIISMRDYIAQIKHSMETERSMKEKELLMESHLKDARLKYLQAQINPHFLFNTLNAGAQLAMMEGGERTYEYVQNVAEFFRYNIKKDNAMVSLADEIKLVDNYIYILNVRFSGEIHYKKNIQEKWLSIKVPGMILQPIVENSVNYGIRDIDWEGVIELSVYEENGYICISVKDNGIGIRKEKLCLIMDGEYISPEGQNDSNGIGLDNVIGRLHLFFDGKDKFEIISEGKNMGTETIISIPIEEDQNV